LRPCGPGLGWGADHDVTVAEREAEPPRAVAALLLIAARQLPARPREMAGGAFRGAPEGVLILGLRLPEPAGLPDLRGHRAGPAHRPEAWPSAIVSSGILRCFPFMQKISDRYSEPASSPWRSRAVGSWTWKKNSRMSR